ncbi:MAG: hypothetical protein Q9M94_04950 [Candidatus Gracilibacteria bacterium]|nr:hypothetical protein [Candidatus Gracilibacteria bacterium]MDQ7022125.1 hypothetical protein [Candidatus Gracilibacteria bacterium]
MAKTQFFIRKSENLEEYKSTFKKALQMSKTVKLFSSEVVIFLDKWINVQKNYIPREDIDNFLTHLNLIFKNKDFYNFIVSEFKTVKNNGKIQEYSFNLISKLDDSSKDFNKSEKKRIISEKLEKAKLNSKKEDEIEMGKILNKL